MGDVLTFTPRSRSPEPAAAEPLSDADLRAHLEEIGHAALDIGQQVAAVLDRLSGEEGANPLPVTAMITGSQEPCLDEAAGAALETVLQLPIEPTPETTVIQVEPLRWGGRGNVIAAVSVALLDMVGVR